MGATVESELQGGHVLILGGGIAGLSAAYFLKNSRIPVTVLDALEGPGGNCRTIDVDGFSFDTGAHRIHDKDPEITLQIKKLMGSSLKRVNAPSRIFDNGRLLSFPIEPRDVFTRMNPSFTIRAGMDLLRSRNGRTAEKNFENFAVRSYGRSMAERFLLNYSRKLWGMPCHELSQEISGERLKNMTLATLIRNLFSKRHAERAHYEGEFYYPEGGIGRLPGALAARIGPESILLGHRVTDIFHNGSRIERIQLMGNGSMDVRQVVSTLPVTDLVAMMRPAPPEMIQIGRAHV